MRIIDLATWPRRRHFALFHGFDNPHFGLCANVDITRARAELKERGLPVTPALIYLLARAANAIPEFRHRIRGAGADAQVVEHEWAHPSPTVLPEDGLFSFCTIPFHPDPARFLPDAQARLQDAVRQPSLEDVPGADDLLYMTCIPWISFTGVQHPMHLRPVDSIPRIAWGRFFEEGGRLKMPLAVQGHHALMDGVHLGRYYALAQELLDQPSTWTEPGP
jgi:chloramphenicol O-acetyltransferase type A